MEGLDLDPGSIDCGETRTNRTLSRKPFTKLARELSRIDDACAARDMLVQWIVIAAAFALAASVHHWLAWLAAAIIIGSRQHALLILMHEASHYHLFTNRRANDVLSDLFCAFPMHILTSGYRVDHLRHHRYTNTPDDPDWCTAQRDPATWIFPKTPLATAAILLGDIAGINIPRHLRIVVPWTYPYLALRRSAPPVTTAEHLRYAGFVAALVSFLAVTNGWVYYLVLWVAPSLTVMMLIFRIRALAEHPFTPAGPEETGEARQVDGTLLERLLIAPLNINHHLVHHLFPSIPHYNLPAMHEQLMASGVYSARGNYFPTYLGLRDGVLGHLIGARSG